MLPRENHRTLGQIFDDIGPSLRSNGPLGTAMLGYLTGPGVVLAAIGVVSGFRRHRAATALLSRVGAHGDRLGARCSRCGHIRATSRRRSCRSRRSSRSARWPSGTRSSAARGCVAARAIAVAGLVLFLALIPALRYEGQVLADPVRTPYPGADLMGFVRRDQRADAGSTPSRRRSSGAAAPTRARRSGPYPRCGYTWGLDLRLNGTAVGAERRFGVISAVPASMATASRRRAGTPRVRATSSATARPAPRRRARAIASSSARPPRQRVRHAPVRAPGARSALTEADRDEVADRQRGARASAAGRGGRPATSARLTRRGRGASFSQ